MSEQETMQRVADATRLVQTIRPLLAGSQPDAVGTALGELVAIFIAGHHPSQRGEARRLLFELINDLTPVVLREMIDDGTAPREWLLTRPPLQ
jgi:hypothetical protein